MISSLKPSLVSVQLIALGISLVSFVVILLWPDDKFDFLLPYIFIFCILSLAFPILEGSITRGSRRWIEIGAIKIQPSEITRILLIWVYAVYLSKRTTDLVNLIKYFLLLLIPVAILLSQPDLGSGILLVFGWLGVLMARGIPKKYVLIGLVVIGICLPFGWNLMHDYQQQRILTFVNPSNDPQGSGYNVIQARLAIGSGQFWGKGLGRGTQSHLRFLPEHHTDFMYASLAEEFGFLGTSILLVLYTILFARMISSSQSSTSLVSSLLILGIFSTLFGQTVINIGMNLGILPVTGVTLPLLSYGGSSLVSTWIMIGIVSKHASKYKLKIAGHIH